MLYHSLYPRLAGCAKCRIRHRYIHSRTPIVVVVVVVVVGAAVLSRQESLPKAHRHIPQEHAPPTPDGHHRFRDTQLLAAVMLLLLLLEYLTASKKSPQTRTIHFAPTTHPFRGSCGSIHTLIYFILPARAWRVS